MIYHIYIYVYVHVCNVIIDVHCEVYKYYIYVYAGKYVSNVFLSKPLIGQFNSARPITIVHPKFLANSGCGCFSHLIFCLPFLMWKRSRRSFFFFFCWSSCRFFVQTHTWDGGKNLVNNGGINYLSLNWWAPDFFPSTVVTRIKDVSRHLDFFTEKSKAIRWGGW